MTDDIELTQHLNGKYFCAYKNQGLLSTKLSGIIHSSLMLITNLSTCIVLAMFQSIVYVY